MKPEPGFLSVLNLTHDYGRDSRRRVQAVGGVSFAMEKGEILGLVGESGSGKSTVARCLMGMVTPSGGHIWYKGVDLAAVRPGKSRWRGLAGQIQMTFQDSVSSLSPRMTAAEIIAEPLVIRGLARSAASCRERVLALMDTVGLDHGHADYYPYECSGGQRQRVGIARALALEPELLIADEPIASLDAPVQEQIIKLLLTLREEKGLAVLFISHDLRMIRRACDWVLVMRNGQIVEANKTRALFEHPGHDYTKSLIASII